MTKRTQKILNIAGICFGLAVALAIAIALLVTYLKEKNEDYFYMTKQEFAQLAESGDGDGLLESAFLWTDNFCPILSKNFSSASAPVKNVQVILHLHYEVLNGGFPQFYFNGYHTYGFEFEEAFRAADLDDVAELYLRVQACFGKIGHTMPSGSSLADFAAWSANNPLESYDEEYAEFQLRVEDALIDYIKENISFFGD